MTKSLKNVKTEKCTLKDLEYGEKTENPDGNNNDVFKTLMGAGEMAQWVRAPDCSSEGLKFKSQQPHGGSQPSVTRSDALFWSV